MNIQTLIHFQAGEARSGHASLFAGYMSGFGNGFETEALPGALPIGRNSPQKCPYGLYAEQLSGSPFTAPRTTNERSWLYRIRPTVAHWGQFQKIDTRLWRTAPAHEADTPIAPMRWDPIPIPGETLSFIEGVHTITTAGDGGSQAGMGAHVYVATRSMQDEYFYNADGEMLVVPQQGRLRFRTEFGVIEVEPGEIAIIPRGVKISVELMEGPSRGYLCENYGGAFSVPERGPIGANCLANPRDFLTPVAAYEDRDAPSRMIVKWGGNLWSTEIDHSPLDVVAWHGNYAPYKYDLRTYSPVGPILFDHADPSIFTVLTSPSETPGTANIDFVIFSDRWLVAENTFRPPWYHMNVMSEFMGLVYGVYDAKTGGGFVPGGISLHNTMLPHGPDIDAFEKASNAELKPHRLEGTLAFMFETRFPQRVTAYAAGIEQLQRDYGGYGRKLAKHFDRRTSADPMAETDSTHDPRRRSWVASANGHPDFPIQNLPLGVFSPNCGAARGGIAIGDEILDIPVAIELGLFEGAAAEAARAAAGPTLNPFLALDQGSRAALRRRASEILDVASPAREQAEAGRESLLHRAADCRLEMPARVGDYTDFYAGIHHATNVGKQFRPDNPLLPNYKYVPIGYHGRASSIGVSGGNVRRPRGQRKPAPESVPSFGPSRNLDYELELGIWVGPGNPLGQPIPIGEAARHIAGFCLLNDWSARDIQGWEYQPLGPFLAKNFATTISPWVVLPEALAPFRIPQPARPEGDPEPLAYLLDPADQREGALQLNLEVLLLTPGLTEKDLPPHPVALSNTRHMYWTASQLVAHHASGGCNLQPGDLFGTGTISGPDDQGFGSLLETTNGGRKPLELASGETRCFLDDGDVVILRAYAERDGYVRIGFGECRAMIVGSAQ